MENLIVFNRSTKNNGIAIGKQGAEKGKWFTMMDKVAGFINKMDLKELKGAKVLEYKLTDDKKKIIFLKLDKNNSASKPAPSNARTPESSASTGVSTPIQGSSSSVRETCMIVAGDAVKVLNSVKKLETAEQVADAVIVIYNKIYSVITGDSKKTSKKSIKENSEPMTSTFTEDDLQPDNIDFNDDGTITESDLDDFC